VGLAFAEPSAYAAGLGRLNVQSALGQPLRAELEVTSVSRDEAGSLAVRMASQSAFRQANLEFNPALAALRFDLERRGETSFVVRITSLQPISEPYLDLLVELTWATGRVLREYTVLLDPPALRATPEVVAPVATPAAPPPIAAAPAPAPAQAPVEAAPPPAVQEPAASIQAAPAAPAPAPAPMAAPAAPAETYTVKRGDTLGKIALQNKPAEVSLDQMLVAMFRANPNAFVGKNMNRLLAGRTLAIPTVEDAQTITAADARREVIAQSADFAQYRSRLAQAATTTAAAAPATSAVQGRVTTKVEDQAAPAKTGDQLQIAKADASGTAAAAATKAQDEAVARQRALKEQEERAAELKKANEQLKKALELQSKAGAQAQKQAEAKVAEPAKAPAPVAAVEPPAPVAEPTKAAPPAVEPAKAEAPAAETPKAEPPKVEPPKAEAPKPAPAKAAPAPAPEQPSPGILDGLFSDSTTLYGLGGLIALLAALLGFNIYRRRRVEKGDEFRATGEGLRANSLFGATGGQSVDTGATSTFNSSFIPAASQLDSNEVDPVAEADVYIAYGREEQAEDILKEALRQQPDRHAVRVKLLEIYSRRGDKASFNAVADELRSRTGAMGEEWERAAKLGRALDPSNPNYAGAAGAAEIATRGPTTELRLNPTTMSPRPPTLGGGIGAAPAASAEPAYGAVARHEPALDLGDLGGPPSVLSPATTQPTGTTTKLVVDTKSDAPGPDTRGPTETKMPADTRSLAGTTTQPPLTTAPFSATLPLDEDIAAPAARAGAPEPVSMKGDTQIDFGALDFDLGSTKADVPPVMPAAAAPKGNGSAAAKPAAAAAAVAVPPPVAAPPTIPDLDLSFPMTGPGARQPATATGKGAMPDLDLNLPSRTPTTVPPPAFSSFAAPLSGGGLDEALSRPTLLGAVGALPDEQAPRLTSNTDQATVPLIDFDLTGSDVEMGGRRTETPAGSPMAAQMATKLDLARGYIDLGVKDGARELLEEVMRDGTREQRQQAVELIKLVEA
jgi:pilus assembly protein FimV